MLWLFCWFPWHMEETNHPNKSIIRAVGPDICNVLTSIFAPTKQWLMANECRLCDLLVEVKIVAMRPSWMMGRLLSRLGLTAISLWFCLVWARPKPDVLGETAENTWPYMNLKHHETSKGSSFQSILNQWRIFQNPLKITWKYSQKNRPISAARWASR